MGPPRPVWIEALNPADKHRTSGSVGSLDMTQLLLHTKLFLLSKYVFVGSKGLCQNLFFRHPKLLLRFHAKIQVQINPNSKPKSLQKNKLWALYWLVHDQGRIVWLQAFIPPEGSVCLRLSNRLNRNQQLFCQLLSLVSIDPALITVKAQWHAW